MITVRKIGKSCYEIENRGMVVDEDLIDRMEKAFDEELAAAKESQIILADVPRERRKQLQDVPRERRKHRLVKVAG